MTGAHTSSSWLFCNTMPSATQAPSAVQRYNYLRFLSRLFCAGRPRSQPASLRLPTPTAFFCRRAPSDMPRQEAACTRSSADGHRTLQWLTPCTKRSFASRRTNIRDASQDPPRWTKKKISSRRTNICDASQDLLRRAKRKISSRRSNIRDASQNPSRRAKRDAARRRRCSCDALQRRFRHVARPRQRGATGGARHQGVFSVR